MDDTHTTTIFIARAQTGTVSGRLKSGAPIPGISADGIRSPLEFRDNTTDWLGRWRLVNAPENDYLIDRELQRNGGVYSGIVGIQVQDNAIAGTMGPNPHTCICTADQVSGSVWGSGPYTTDSSVFKAAVHARTMAASGGEVSAKAAAGCNAYAGSVANGVTSSKWGPYQQSFIFSGQGGQAGK